MVCIAGEARIEERMIDSIHQGRETTFDGASDTNDVKQAPSKKSQQDERQDVVFCKSPTKSVSRYIA